MSATTDSRPVEGSGRDDSGAGFNAGRAAAQLSLAWAMLGALGLGACAFVLLRLIETWRVTPRVSHHISFLGQTLDYPTANAGAIVVLVLAAVGLAVVARALIAATRELTASRRLARRLAAGAPEPLKDALVIDDQRPRAFCAGFMRPRIYVSSGALAILDEPALDAVLMHERHHARRRDPLRLAAGRVLAAAMFFVPGLGELGRRQETLAELGADEGAISAAPGNRAALARAMLTFSDAARPGVATGVDPERVDNLLGDSPDWRFPAALVAAGAGMLALLAAVGALAGSVAAGSASLTVPFLSAQPCVAVLATIPAALVLAGAWLAASRRRAAPALGGREGSSRPGV
ncbi:MAG TPA: M56 family metallopeptidase [Solirubrobacteraceae bacterium]|nr:M56 family metallopeptidase [Solirubrobacteraceae bacterium]